VRGVGEAAAADTGLRQRMGADAADCLMQPRQIAKTFCTKAAPAAGCGTEQAAAREQLQQYRAKLVKPAIGII